MESFSSSLCLLQMGKGSMRNCYNTHCVQTHLKRLSDGEDDGGSGTSSGAKAKDSEFG